MTPEEVRRAASEMGIALTPAQAEQFVRYDALLREWNARINLTRITDPANVLALHFLDSLSALPLIQPRTQTTPSPVRLLDVGSGAGLPGIPLKIALPALDVTLLDGTAKKLDFCRAVIAALGLSSIRTLHGRAEDIARLPTHREQYDVVIARAVAPLPTLVEYLLPLARVGGLCIAMKGSNAAAETEQALGAIERLGGSPPTTHPVQLPGRDERRALIAIAKARPTPPRYPRPGDAPRRAPLK